jgi:putative sporulation protein YyaC
MEENSVSNLTDALCEYLFPVIKERRQLVFLCIGTDRSTGDSLGPLIGHKLKFLSIEGINIFGNLEFPVHAKNLRETIDHINSIIKNPFFIAIDACLGTLHNVGKIYIESKPIFPGSAVNKQLPPIGDLSITGIVNISGSLEFMVLQNTRLYTVMKLADIISKAIYLFILKNS